MKLGIYIFATVILTAIIAAFTYTINPNTYTVEIMGVPMTFPIAVWVVIPMMILFVLTVMHILFYGLRNYFMLKKWQRDTLTLEDALYWSLVNEPKAQKYGIETLGNTACILSKASLNVTDNIDGLNPRLSHIVNMIQKIKKGEYIDLKEEKMAKVFNSGNPILIQNRLNRLSSDEKFVEDVLKATSEYSDVVQAEALSVFAATQNFTNARKYINVFDVPNFLAMLQRITSEDDLELTSEILTEFVKALDLSCHDFIEIALVTKKHLRPEENLTLFRSYQEENFKAQSAYLYLLFEYELIEQVGIYLDEQEADEFLKFRAFYALKKQDAQYQLQDILDIHALCKKPTQY